MQFFFFFWRLPQCGCILCNPFTFHCLPLMSLHMSIRQCCLWLLFVAERALLAPVFIMQKYKKQINGTNKTVFFFMPCASALCPLHSFLRKSRGDFLHVPPSTPCPRQMLCEKWLLGGVKRHLNVAKWLFASAKEPLFRQHFMPWHHICAV